MEKISDGNLIETSSTCLQRETEDECRPYFIDGKRLSKNQIDHLIEMGLLPKDYEKSSPISENIRLLRWKHLTYLRRSLLPKSSYSLPKSFISLDASKPWIIYWSLQALDLLGAMDSNSHMCSFNEERQPNNYLTEHYLDDQSLIGVIDTLNSCWTDVPIRLNESVESFGCLFGHDAHDRNTPTGGGFGGGPGQLPHCAPSYAAVLTLCIIAGCDSTLYPLATQMARDVLNRKRKPLYLWFLSLRQELHDNQLGCASNKPSYTVAYSMHHDGEVDVRAAYTVLCMSSLLNILTPALTKGVIPFIASCQTYEGGFGGEPNAEAHGGYTFCALAAMRLLTASPLSRCMMPTCSHCNSPSTQADSVLLVIQQSGIDFHSLKRWLVYRQLSFEGGFSGRTNKLVDGCYSFWLGASIAILNIMEKSVEKSDGKSYGVVYDACVRHQHVFWMSNPIFADTKDLHVVGTVNDEDSLLLDRILLQRYILLCGQDLNGGLRDKPSKPRDHYHSCYVLSGLSVSQHVLTSNVESCPVFGDDEFNRIFPTHPVYNIRLERVERAVEQFRRIGTDRNS